MMMKKKISFLFLLLILFFISGCNSTTTINTTITIDDYVALPDLIGMNRDEIKETLDQIGIEYVFGFDQTKYYGPNGYNVFASYQNRSIGDKVKKGNTIRVYTSPLELPSIDKTALKFERDLEGKSFINDSYGYCTWAGEYADGDTATFIDNITKERFRVRFLSIDTPEVNHGNGSYDPWGDAAQDYVLDLLSKAKVIIVESELDDTKGLDVYGRYLGYVWVDGICLNYAVLCEAYTNYTGNSQTSKYDSYFSEADSLVSVTGRRFFGEYDPDYTLY